MTELKPCPNCQSDNKHIHVLRHRGVFTNSWIEYYVKCDNCGFALRSSYLTESKAVKAWNRRVGEEV